MENKNIPYELSDYVLGKYFREASSKWLNVPAVIAAVSGGGDSLSLLWMCRKFYAGRVVAFHVHHGMRGAIADSDEEFVADFARSIGAEFRSVRVSVPNERMKGEGIEETGRRLRHQHICRTAHELGINTVLLGHNRDDLAETVLFNLIRGTGIRGSVGITESSYLDGITFHRPLLGLRRKFLRDILRVRGMTWRHDSTNDLTEYTRNYMRLKLLPEIVEKINTEAIEHLASFGEDMRKVRTLEDTISTKLVSEVLISQSPLILDRKKLRALNDDDTALVIRELGRRLELRTLSRSRCAELVRLVHKQEPFMFQWCGEVTVQGRGGKIIINDDTGNIE